MERSSGSTTRYRISKRLMGLPPKVARSASPVPLSPEACCSPAQATSACETACPAMSSWPFPPINRADAFVRRRRLVAQRYYKQVELPAHAWFRFYAELNDHLPPESQYQNLEKCFFVPASVKDMIESFGVPHTEVELILVNGESTDFSRLIRAGDRVAVYPV